MILTVFNLLPVFLLKTLEYGVMLLNKIIHWIASFEFFIIKDISFNLCMLLGSYLFIIALIIWLKNPGHKKLISCLISLIFLQLTFIEARWDSKKTKEWIVFSMKKNSLIAERKNNKIFFYSNENLTGKIQNNKIVKSYLLKNFSTIEQQKTIENVAYFNRKKILIIDNTGIYPKTSRTDILLLLQSPPINLERILQTLQPELIVADASNYKSYVTNWKKTCKQQKIPFHDVSEKGFYKIYE